MVKATTRMPTIVAIKVEDAMAGFYLESASVAMEKGARGPRFGCFYAYFRGVEKIFRSVFFGNL